MTFLSGPELFIIWLTAAALMLVLLCSIPRAASGIAGAAALLGLLRLVMTRHDPRLEMVPVYLTALILAATGGRSVLRERKGLLPLRKKWKGLKKALRIAVLWGALYILAIPLMVAPMISDGYNRDLTRLGWTEAFDAMHEDLSQEYPFTSWKGIDWDELKKDIRPLIAEGETEADWDDYVLALRSYVYRIPDGHVRFSAPDGHLRQEAVGGGFGMNLGQTEDGAIVVTEVFSSSPADRAGIRFGTAVETWAGKPVREALEDTELSWAARPPATKQNRQLEQLRFLVRAAAGTRVRLSATLPGKAEPETFDLVAEADAELTLSASDPYAFAPRDGAPLETSLLENRYGYIRLKVQRFPDRSPALMRKAVDDFSSAAAAGIIIDLRGNRGGSDFAVPLLVSPFFQNNDLYHHPALYDPITGRFREIPFNTMDPFIPVISYRVHPRRPAYQGPVAVLIDQSTSSSAEGIALLLGRLPNTELIGFYGTSGILGSGNVKSWLLPGNIRVQMLSGRSLDARGEIQVDADAKGSGGVLPTIRIPKTLENLRAVFMENRDLPLEKAMEWIRETSAGTAGMTRP